MKTEYQILKIEVKLFSSSFRHLHVLEPFLLDQKNYLRKISDWILYPKIVFRTVVENFKIVLFVHFISYIPKISPFWRPTHLKQSHIGIFHH